MRFEVCLGCNLRVEPIRVTEKDKTGKLWTITRCPRDRCNFNIDIIESAADPKSRTNLKDQRRNFWKGDHWE